jgi:hypothetical protein
MFSIASRHHGMALDLTASAARLISSRRARAAGPRVPLGCGGLFFGFGNGHATWAAYSSLSDPVNAHSKSL